MRVMQIDVNYKYSSTGKIVHELHQQLMAHGHQSFVVYGRGQKIKEPNVYKFGLDIETYLHAFLTRLTGLTGSYSPFSTARLLSKIRRFKPDVIHIHELHAYFVNHNQLIRYLKKHRIPIVWTFHCEYMYTGKCGHAHDCTKFMKECHHCPQLKEYPKSLFIDFTRHMFRIKKRLLIDYPNLKIVTPSLWLKQRVELSFLKDFPTQVIHNGINTMSLFRVKDVEHLRQQLNISEDQFIVLSIAPNIMSIQKGGPLVVKLAERLIDAPIHFILVGAESLHVDLPPNVTLFEKIYDAERIVDFYNLADVSLIFSQRENFPTTAIESLACGTPILAFDTGGTKETATQGFGKFLKYGDLRTAELMLRDIQSSRKTKDIQEACSRIYRELYSQHRMYENYEKVYLAYDPTTV